MKKAKEYQETHQEIEKESQRKDLEYFEEVKQKYSLEPETIKRTEEYLKKEKYETSEGQGKEELKEYFKNKFLELLEEQIENTEEFKRKWEPLLDKVPSEEINYLIVEKAIENLADDPKMSKEKGKWLKAILRSRDIDRAAIKGL